MNKKNIIVVFSSHYSEEDNQLFKDHISSTIGCKHKIVCYENHNEFSLTEIYNKAIKRYHNDESVMVFCHNDIVFRTNKWGRNLLTKFNYDNYSIIGVAGSTYLPESGVWWEDRTKMVGIVEHTDGINTWVSEYSKEKKGQITPVVLIDGLFIAVDCNNIEHLFDEEFDGFHLYDLSLCVPNWLDGINIGVTTDIRILHKSVGQTNEHWVINKNKLVEKYKDELPINYEY